MMVGLNEHVVMAFSEPGTVHKHHIPTLFLLKNLRGVWVAPLIKHLNLDFGSGHDLTVVKSGSTLEMESA